MMSFMNLAWFIAVWYLYLAVKNIGEETTLYDFFVSESFTIFNWSSGIYTLLFGLSHWMFVMNYLTLAMRIKCLDQSKFECHMTWLNIMYYGFGTLNVCLPISQTVLFVQEVIASNYV